MSLYSSLAWAAGGVASIVTGATIKQRMNMYMNNVEFIENADPLNLGVTFFSLRSDHNVWNTAERPVDEAPMVIFKQGSLWVPRDVARVKDSKTGAEYALTDTVCFIDNTSFPGLCGLNADGTGIVPPSELEARRNILNSKDFNLVSASARLDAINAKLSTLPRPSEEESAAAFAAASRAATAKQALARTGAPRGSTVELLSDLMALSATVVWQPPAEYRPTGQSHEQQAGGVWLTIDRAAAPQLWTVRNGQPAVALGSDAVFAGMVRYNPDGTLRAIPGAVGFAVNESLEYTAAKARATRPVMRVLEDGLIAAGIGCIAKAVYNVVVGAGAGERK